MQETGASGSENGANGGNTDNSNMTTTDITMSNTAVIAGAVVGSVGGTALIALIAFLLYRRSRKTKQAEAAAPTVSETGKPELDSTSVAQPPTASSSPSLKKSPIEDVSPVSPYAPPPMPELHNQPPPTPELHGRETQRIAYEAYSQQVYEAPGQTRTMVSEAHGLQGMGWQSGPVPQAYEMDASDIRNQTPRQHD